MVETKVPINAVSDGTTLDIHRSPSMSNILYWLEMLTSIFFQLSSTTSMAMQTLCVRRFGIFLMHSNENKTIVQISLSLSLSYTYTA